MVGGDKNNDDGAARTLQSVKDEFMKHNSSGSNQGHFACKGYLLSGCYLNHATNDLMVGGYKSSDDGAARTWPCTMKTNNLLLEFKSGTFCLPGQLIFLSAALCASEQVTTA